jgi:hypothetical protein
MIFKLNSKTLSLDSILGTTTWVPKELKLEKYLLSTIQSERPLLRPEVFGEELLPIGHQIQTKQGKRVDILAVDQLGNSVIIELKKDAGRLGVETQALQYLAEFSIYKGKKFITQFSQIYRSFMNEFGNLPLNKISLEEEILGFTGHQTTEQINQNSRIILIARGFDPVLFSMGKWFADNGVPFRCLEYVPFEIGTEKFIGFSLVFDDSPSGIFPLTFSSFREPQYFWHNIGASESKPQQEWWDYLVKTSQIAASFSNQPGDEGEKLLREYVKGDRILAYSSGHGALGYGVTKNPGGYELIKPNTDDDLLEGRLRHRLPIEWKVVIHNLNHAIKAQTIKNLGGYHPIRTKVRIDKVIAEKLIKEIERQAIVSQQ